MNLVDDNTLPLPLWWENTNTGAKTCAGVAFFDEKFGEFRLKIDSLISDDHAFYCHATESDGDKTLYRVEVAKKKNGKFWRRQKVGEGYCASHTMGEIYLCIPPFDSGHRLIITLDNKKMEKLNA